MRHYILICLLALSFSAMAEGQIQVMGLFPGKAILQVDGKRYTLSIGEATPGGIKLISADSDKAIIEVEGKRRTLLLGSQISNYYPEAKKKVVDIYPDSLGMYHVQGNINNHSVNFLVDTGASDIAMNSRVAKRLGIDYMEKGIEGIANTAAGRVTIYQIQLNEVTVGTIRLYNVKAMVIDGAQPAQVLLGQSFLNQLHMKREGALLRLEQSH